MNNFLEQVEFQLRSKSLHELKAFITKLAVNIPAASRQNFLEILENKRVIIDKTAENKADPQTVLDRIKKLLDEIEDYEIEAYYNDGGWYGDDSFTIENDDGFADEFSYCYNAAELLLSNGQFKAAAKAFCLLFQVIDEFDEHNQDHDFGELYFDTFIDNDLIKIDFKKAKALRGYSALMAGESDLEDELASIYEMCDTYENRLMFKDVLEAGSIPVPNLDNILIQWLNILYNQPPAKASAYIKEAVRLAGKPEIMENFVKNQGMGEPAVYLDLCEMFIEMGESDEKLAQIAMDGLAKTAEDAKKREQLASLLANTAEKMGDQETYTYAILERFYSYKNLENYVPIFELESQSANQQALTALESARAAESRVMDVDYYIIHLLNRNYDMVFEAVKKDKGNLGWSGSLKGSLFPFFLGLVSGFEEKTLMIKKLINDSIDQANGEKVYRLLSDNMGFIPAEQDKKWNTWCVKEARGRIDAIVSGTHRGSYYKAARLLIAICEMQKYKKNGGTKEEPTAILHEYWAKYPRHSAFRGEVKTALQEAKLQVNI